MADITLVKISALPAAEQIGAEDLLPVVQEGATKAVTYGVIKEDIAEELAPDATLSEAGKAADAKAVGDALALKADKTELTAEVNRIDAALNTKVNNATYTAEVERIDGAIATKADAAATTAALATKANANDVTAALALKADTAAVNAQLATKADTATVNAALATKADADAVTSALDLKADKTELAADMAMVITTREPYNLLDITKLTNGQITSNGKTIEVNSTRYTSDWIPAEEGDVFYLTGINANGDFQSYDKNRIVRYYFYSDKDLNTAIASPTDSYVGVTQPAPEGTKYVRISWTISVYGYDNNHYPCFTKNEFPTSAAEVKPYTEEKTELINQPQVDNNTADIVNVTRVNKAVRTIAHQGYKVKAPKCTKWAFIAAKMHGFDTVESDITYSAEPRTFFMWHDSSFAVCGDVVDADNGYGLYTDGTAYYWYDSVTDTVYDTEYNAVSVSVGSLTRVNGSSLTPSATPWDVLKNMDVGAYYGEGFRGTHLQTFEEWALLCKELGLDMYIDRKVNTTSALNEIVGYVKQIGMLDHTSWVINTDGSLGTAIRAIDPNARLLLLTRPTEEQLPAIASLAAAGRGVAFDFINTSTTSESVSTAVANGIEPEAYYVNYNQSVTEAQLFAEIRRLVDIGCTGLTLDTYFVHEAFADMYNEYLSIIG